MRDFADGLAAVQTRENKFGFIDRSGRLKIEAKFDWAASFSDDRAAVFVDGKHGFIDFIDKEGKFIVKPKYANASSFSEGLACVKLGGRVRNPTLRDQVIITGGNDRNHGYIDVAGTLVFRVHTDTVILVTGWLGFRTVCTGMRDPVI